MDKIERDRIEAKLPPDREYRMPPEMTNAMRGAAWDAYAKVHIEASGKIEWKHICSIFCAAMAAQGEEP